MKLVLLSEKGTHKLVILCMRKISYSQSSFIHIIGYKNEMKGVFQDMRNVPDSGHFSSSGEMGEQMDQLSVGPLWTFLNCFCSTKNILSDFTVSFHRRFLTI